MTPREALLQAWRRRAPAVHEPIVEVELAAGPAENVYVEGDIITAGGLTYRVTRADRDMLKVAQLSIGPSQVAIHHSVVTSWVKHAGICRKWWGDRKKLSFFQPEARYAEAKSMRNHHHEEAASAT